MRCIYKESKMKIVTEGGNEFVVPLQQRISKVYPLEDGILIQCYFEPDLLRFNPSILAEKKRKTFIYFTVVGHPLNEVHILGQKSATSDLISPLVDYDLDIVKNFSEDRNLPILIVYSR